MKNRGLSRKVLLGCLMLAVSLSGSGCGGRPSSAASAASAAGSQSQSESVGTEAGTSAGKLVNYDDVEKKLAQIQEIIDQYYISPDGSEEITAKDMEEGIYKGYVDSLNEPYTVYYTQEEYDTLMESSSGRYSGIGVVVTQNVKTGVVSVVRPFIGSPGAEAGLVKDDIITKVDGQETAGVDLNKVVSWIKGEAGTKVELEIYRESEKEYHTVSVERRQIEVPEVEYKMLDGQIGYVGILEFEQLTAEQFDKAVDDLESQGMKAMVIDLRDNPGGLLTSATEVLDRILPKDKLLVYTIDKKGAKVEDFSTDDEIIDIPMVILTNGNTASASEIVSGCLQDYQEATLVGTKTYGKGIVQYVLPLGDGSAIKLTSAKYYTPKDRNIHGIGIEPDVTVELEENDEVEAGVSWGSAGLTADGEVVMDNQMQKALEILQGQ